MKKVSLMVIGAVAALGMLFTSCKKDEKTAPTISMLQISNATETKAINVSKTDTVAVVADADYKFTWAVTKGSSDLTKMDIKAVGPDGVFTQSITDAKLIASGYLDSVSCAAGNTVVTVTVTDKDNQTVTAAFVLKATATAPEISTFAAATLGAQNAAEGGFYSITDGTVIMGANAAANTDKIYITIADLGAAGSVKTKLLSYAFRADASTGLDAAKVPSTAKKTYFKKVTGVNFATATKTEVAALTVATTDSQIIEIAQGDVIAFLTETGKKGLISIKTYNNLAPTLKSTASIEVKVQK